MKRLLTLLIVIALLMPKTVFASPSGQSISVSEAVTYVAEANPLTGDYTVEYKSTLTVRNDGESASDYRFIQRLFRVNASTLELPKEARLLSCSGDFCIVEWVVKANPGASIFEARGEPLWTPLSVDAEVRVNGGKPSYSSAYGIFFVEAKEGDAVEWRIGLRNNNPILRDTLTNISSKPPLFVSVSITLPEKYFKDVVYDPPINMTSMLEKDTVSWMLILRDSVDINVRAVVRGFDDWGTIPLMPISVSFSPMGDSVRESISSQLKSLNMSMSLMEAILSPLSNFTSFIELEKSMIGNLSYALESTGNQTIVISDALKTIGSQLGYAASQLSNAVSTLSTIMKNVSKIDFKRVREALNSSKRIASEVLNSTLRVITDAENDLLEVKNILADLRGNLTDPDQVELVDNVIERIDRLYNNLKSFENQLRALESQIGPLFNSIESFVSTLEEYSSSIMESGSELSRGVSALSQVSSVLLDISQALRLIGEVNRMMGRNITSMMPLLENASSGFARVSEALEGNLTSLKKAYDELSTFLRLTDYGENRVKLMAPDESYESSIVFKPVLNEYDSLLRLDAILLDNNTTIGVREVKVYYNGTFQGLLLNGSTVLQGFTALGVDVSNGSVTISQYRSHDRGNILTLWNGQGLSLLFSNTTRVIVDVDYSILDNLGERSEALSYSIIQPTLGKGFSIVTNPSGETQPLKTGLNTLTILLALSSVIAAVILLYAFRRRREVIVI